MAFGNAIEGGTSRRTVGKLPYWPLIANFAGGVPLVTVACDPLG